jgi:hypothetical protein
LSFERPTLCFLVEEVGGRAELRARPDTPAEGEYFGTDHLTLLAAADPITLYSTSLRSAQFACFVLHPQEAGCLTVEQAELISRAPSRLMFKDNRLHTCAQMLSTYEGDDERDAYGLGLRHALFAALVGLVSDPVRPSADRLTGRQLARVLTHIVEHLHQRVSNESLAHLAESSPTQFGSALPSFTGAGDSWASAPWAGGPSATAEPATPPAMRKSRRLTRLITTSCHVHFGQGA